MRVNHKIIVSALILMAAGTYNVYVVQNGKQTRRPSVTRIIVGGYMLAIVASIVDLISPETGYLAGLLMLLAVVTMLYTVLPDLFSRLSSQQKGA